MPAQVDDGEDDSEDAYGDLGALVHHEADAVSEAIACTSHLPARVDHVDLSLDLTSISISSDV